MKLTKDNQQARLQTFKKIAECLERDGKKPTVYAIAKEMKLPMHNLYGLQDEFLRSLITPMKQAKRKFSGMRKPNPDYRIITNAGLQLRITTGSMGKGCMYLLDSKGNPLHSVKFKAYGENAKILMDRLSHTHEQSLSGIAMKEIVEFMKSEGVLREQS